MTEYSVLVHLLHNNSSRTHAPASWDVLSTAEVCRPGINSSGEDVSVSESRSDKKKNLSFPISYIQCLYRQTHMVNTIRLRVISFIFLSSSEVGEVVVIEGVPRRLCGGVGGPIRGRGSTSSFAVVLRCIANTRLSAHTDTKQPCHQERR